ncbi:LacI family transcriptional regulator [Agromyces mediolanus]|uniref:LacI family DNA-binding transcriptional regulator n=1 Tax=Agromyces mediolanus TaxID=41986 RepID=UPI00203D6C20|nr:LacI family DNA-binding transcriptional regulator [Agromyces mediolanus]MCM3659033.1 LacI family transcriptional regulator [Agromyces mediolanus]
MGTTLKDLAGHLGISAAAVSMALNGKPGVSEQTREEVRRAAEELGYRPNRTGQALRLSRTNTIGVYFPSTVMEYSLYFAEIMRGIVAGFADTELSPLLLPSAGRTGQVRDFPEVDGVVVVEPHSDDLGMFELLRSGRPTVCIDPPPPSAAAPWGVVEADAPSATRDSLRHIVSRGAARPGLLTIETVSEWSRTIEASYREWCSEHRVEPAVIAISARQSNEEILELLERELGADVPCDGLFVAGDAVAPRIAGLLRTIGRSPEDGFPLVSGVDSTMMEFHTPPITAIDLNPYGYGMQAARMMGALLLEPNRPGEPRIERLPAPLVVRGT